MTRSVERSSTPRPAPAAVALLRAHRLDDDDDDVQRALVVAVPDALGEQPTLYPVDSVTDALGVRAVASSCDELVADSLSQSAGIHRRSRISPDPAINWPQ